MLASPVESRESARFDPLDEALARWMSERDPDHAKELAAAVRLLSMARREGHTALRLTGLGKATAAGLEPADLAELTQALKRSRLVGSPGDQAPLVLDGDLLSFRRFHAGEGRIREAVKSRLDLPAHDVDVERLRPLFSRLFTPDIDGEVNWQAVAATAALSSRFLCIAGGPGTGKTTTVIRLMALLLENNPDLRIRLAAPTGKAANRMAESVAAQLEGLDVDATLKERIPTTSATIHRLLGYRPTQARFRLKDDQKLDADVVIVDEASMIDHELFTALLAALDDRTRLILLGDPDQLPSIDAGFVFGDLCRAGEGTAHSRPFVERLRSLGLGALPPVEEYAPPVRDAVITLRRGFRFGPRSGIGKLAFALRDGEPDSVREVLAHDYEDLLLVPHTEMKRTVRRAVRDFARLLVDADSAEAALGALGRLRVLSPLRVGPTGVEALNEELDAWLLEERVRPRGNEYSGKPVLIDTNDYDVSLFNGDVGVLWDDGDGRVAGCFQSGEGVRTVPVGRLPSHEVAWAMTIHKSQGSEFDHVIIVLPENEHGEKLTRELLYTAVTRARGQVTIVGDVDVIAGASERREERVTGLAAGL